VQEPIGRTPAPTLGGSDFLPNPGLIGRPGMDRPGQQPILIGGPGGGITSIQQPLQPEDQLQMSPDGTSGLIGGPNALIPDVVDTGFMPQPATDFQTSLPVNQAVDPGIKQAINPVGFTPPSLRPSPPGEFFGPDGKLVGSGGVTPPNLGGNDYMPKPPSDLRPVQPPQVATNQKGLASIGTQQKNMFAAPMFAEGGEIESPNQSNQTDMMQDPITQNVIMFILGETDDENAINMFIEKYGSEAFMQLRDMILKQAAGNPNAQTEGLIQGKGNSGMADDLPMNIGKFADAAVSQDEYIVPADVVSMLGDGSSDAGSKQLDGMLDRVRQEKTGGKIQAAPIDPSKVMPA